jgi:hypothetical protein
MSVFLTYDVFCDECNIWVHGSTESIREARKKAKMVGWGRMRINGRMVDLCPKHYKEFKAIKSKARENES